MHSDLAGARVVRDLQHRFLLDHARSPAFIARDARRLGEGFLHLPALPLRERAVLDDPDLVPDAAGVALVVRHEPRVAAHVLFVLRILDEPLDANDDGLVHLVAHDGAVHHPAVATLTHRLAPPLSLSAAPARSRSTVSMRATSRRSRRSFAVFSSCPVAKRTRAPKYSLRVSRAFVASSSSRQLAQFGSLHAPSSRATKRVGSASL